MDRVWQETGQSILNAGSRVGTQPPCGGVLSFSSDTAPQSRVLYSCLAAVQGMEWSGRAWKQGDVGGHWSERYWWPEPGCVSKDGETGLRGAGGRKGRSC